MNLINAKITPGIVKEVVDDYGLIKATVYGVFSKDENPNDLPPIYPFFTTIHGTFSRPTVGEKIWVISSTDNPMELLYFKQPENTEDIKNVIKEVGSDQVEIVSNYDAKNGWAQIFFADGTGWMIRNDGVFINITNDKIVLSTKQKHRTISITDEGISLGSEGQSKEQAVLGNSLYKLLCTLSANIKGLSNTASISPYTASLAKPLMIIGQDIEDQLQDILSEEVTLD